METLYAVVIVLAFLALYVLPSIIAERNGKRNVEAIIIINVFLGWTVVGWVIALAMAVGDNRAVKGKDPKTGRFVAGNKGSRGRPRGSKNKKQSYGAK